MIDGARPLLPYEGSTRLCSRPGIPRDPTQSSSTSSSRGHRKSDAARPRRGGCSGAGLPEGGNLHDPLLPCDWEDKGPYTVTVYLGTGRGAAAPQARADTANGIERRKRRRSMLGSPASIREAERLTTALVTYGYIFVQAEVILVCHAEGLDTGLGIVHRDASGRAPYRRRGSRSAHLS